MDKIEDYLKYREINDIKFYNDAKNFVKYGKIYKQVNDAYTKNLTTLNNACRIAKTSQRTYYRACEILNKPTIVQLNTETMTELNSKDNAYRLTEGKNDFVNDTESKQLLKDLDKELKDYDRRKKMPQNT
jgi:hypothetical protein